MTASATLRHSPPLPPCAYFPAPLSSPYLSDLPASLASVCVGLPLRVRVPASPCVCASLASVCVCLPPLAQLVSDSDLTMLVQDGEGGEEGNAHLQA